MTGRVFVSCGQRGTDEIHAAESICQVLREFGLAPYVATKIQSLGDIMAITDELRRADYYLFIDFARSGKPEDLPVSLFTHQELALAHHLGFGEQIIALQEHGAPLEGFLRYVQSNPEKFATCDELLVRVRDLVRARGWHSSYSRNLVVANVSDGGGTMWEYADHTGSRLRQVIWQAKIENKRPDAAAVGAVCILDSIRDENGADIDCADRAYLKWAGQSGYERTILPLDFGLVDLFAMGPDQPGLFLHSQRDTPRLPIITANGNYHLKFKVFAKDFPLLQFSVSLKFNWETSNWYNRTSAVLDLV